MMYRREGSVPKKCKWECHLRIACFTFRELAAATRNFRHECFLGEGGSGRVNKGRLDSGEHREGNLFFSSLCLFFSCHLIWMVELADARARSATQEDIVAHDSRKCSHNKRCQGYEAGGQRLR